MNDREKIIERLAKIKALSHGGVGGERENAERLLESVAKKYGINLDSICGKEEEKRHFFKAKKGWRLKMIAQLLGLARIEEYGDPDSDHCCLYRQMNGKKTVGFYAWCTDSQWLEVMAKFSILSSDYEKQHKAFFRAFLEANNLLTPYREDKKRTKKDAEEAEVASVLALGIRKSVLRKQIEGVTE